MLHGLVRVKMQNRSQFKAKIMVCLWLKPRCSVLIHILERGEAITTQSYIRNCLGLYMSTINKQRPTSATKNIKFHHYNDKPHEAKCVKIYLKRNGFTIIRY
jgi:hypothetical protein